MSTSFYIDFGMLFQIVCFDLFEKLVPKPTPKLRVLGSIWPPRAHQKRSWNKNLIFYLYWFEIGSIVDQFRCHIDSFFMTFDAVVDTCFVDLELAPPSNHGSWFVGFSKGAAVTLRVYNDFWHPFWHFFFDLFKNVQKHRFHCRTNIVDMFFASKSIYFQIAKILIFSYFFKTVPRERF